MHRSLNQGKFFVNKKRSHQYLDNNKKTLLREGFVEGNAMMTDEPAKASDNWYEFASQQVDFGINTGLESSKPTIKQIENWVKPNDSNWSDELSKAINNVCKGVQDSEPAIYAFLVDDGGNVTYYSVDNDGNLPENPKPKLKQNDNYTTYLKIDNGMIEAVRKTLIVDDPINKSVKSEREEYQKLQTIYDKALTYYTDETNSYYTAKSEAAKFNANKPHRNSVIKYDDNGTTKYAFINTLGMKRDFNIPTSELSSYNNSLTTAFNDSNFRSKIGCPTPVSAGSVTEVENAQYGTGVPITKTFGGCLNPGLYQSEDGSDADKLWMAEDGQIFKLAGFSSQCQNQGVNSIKAGTYQVLSSQTGSNEKEADFKCLLGQQSAQATMNQHKTNSENANADLQEIADCKASEDGGTCTLRLGTDIYGNDFNGQINGGMKQVISGIQSSVGEAGYRKLHHAIMNDENVHLPIDDGDGKALPHYNEDGSRVDDPYKDISGNLALQRRLNDKLRLVDNLGSSVDSLEASLSLRNRQIKAVNLQFLAWGLAGVTIAFIAAKQFSKK